jgi:hypothetical protein
VLFRRRKSPFSSSKRCYFRRDLIGSFPGPVHMESMASPNAKYVDSRYSTFYSAGRDVIVVASSGKAENWMDCDRPMGT